jgi:outer membrane lipoprotein SlyB
MRPWWKKLPIVGLMLVAGCASLPTGPSVMSLPGSRKTFDEFRVDDADCRQFASVQVGGTTPQKAATDSGVASAVVGTAVGAGAGALIGGSQGAGVGAGVGLVTGALVGQSYAGGAYYSVQQRYDNAYQQCMYAKGHKIQVSGQFARSLQERSAAAAPPGPVAPIPPPPNAPPPR